MLSSQNNVSGGSHKCCSERITHTSTSVLTIIASQMALIFALVLSRYHIDDLILVYSPDHNGQNQMRFFFFSSDLWLLLFCHRLGRWSTSIKSR